jgi:hypothetical protein
MKPMFHAKVWCSPFGVAACNRGEQRCAARNE